MEEKNRQSPNKSQDQQNAGANESIQKPDADVVDYGRSGQPQGQPNQQSDAQDAASAANTRPADNGNSTQSRPLDKDEGKMNNGELGGAV